MTYKKFTDVKVRERTVCAESAALWDAGVNNDALAAASDETESVRRDLHKFDWQNQRCPCHQFNGNYFLMHFT